MTSLLFRQDKVLDQLNDLKSKLVSIQGELNVSPNTTELLPTTSPNCAHPNPKIRTCGKDRPVALCGKQMHVSMHQQFVHKEQMGITEKPINVSYHLCTFYNTYQIYLFYL